MSKLKKNSFIQGTLIVSLILIIIKILGALYIIPYYKIIGEEGGVFYTYAYNIYDLFLNISTAGIPSAISMIISEYLAENKLEAKERAYSISKRIIFILSCTSFLLIFIFATPITRFITDGKVSEEIISYIVPSVRAVSLCILIVPFLSILRGYMQGHKFITPSSTSQLIEQIIRIIFLLLSSYLIIKIFKLNTYIAVAVSLLGTFLGALFAYIYLLFKVKNNKKEFIKSNKKDDITNKEIIKKIISYSIPLIIISITSSLYNNIDLKFINRGLNEIGYSSETVSVIASIISTLAPKICMIIVAISMALTTSLIPHMIKSYTENKMKEVNSIFNQAILAMIYITLPMALAIIVLSDETYFLFYGASKYGSTILKYVAVVNIFVGILTVLNSALQGMKKFNIIYINTVVGLGVNVALDVAIIKLLHTSHILPDYVGTLIATILGTLVSYIIVLIYLKKSLKFNYKIILKNISKLILPSIVMYLLLVILKNNINLETTRIYSLIKIGICGFISLCFYIFITYKNKVIEDIFGKEYINKILNKLKR